MNQNSRARADRSVTTTQVETPSRLPLVGVGVEVEVEDGDFKNVVQRLNDTPETVPETPSPKSQETPKSVETPKTVETAQSLEVPSITLHLRKQHTPVHNDSGDTSKGSPSPKASPSPKGSTKASPKAAATKLHETKTIVSTDAEGKQITETFTELEGGIVSGSREADGWRELWLTQQGSDAREVRRYGQSRGIDRRTRRLWIEDWYEAGDDTTHIHKLVVEFDAAADFDLLEENPAEMTSQESHIVQCWEERVAANLKTGEQKHTKFGADVRTQSSAAAGEDRRWKEETLTVRSQVVSRFLEEKNHQETRTLRETLDAQKRSRKLSVAKLRPQPPGEGSQPPGEGSQPPGEVLESWEEAEHEVFQDNAPSERHGVKRGVNQQGESWKETWEFKNPNQNRVLKLRLSSDKRTVWGDLNGCAIADGEPEQFDEHWESHLTPDGEAKTVTRETLVDKWWSRAEGTNRWGEKKRFVETRLQQKGDGDIGTDAGSGATGSGATKLEFDDSITECSAALTVPVGRLKSISEVNEKWVDSAQERSVDFWKVKSRVDPASQEVLEVSREGEKRGSRCGEGTEWGEKWQSQEALGVVTDKSNDKWWREPWGNSWGEKHEEDVVRSASTHETWYDNGRERLTNRWKVEPDGSSHGEKVGSKTTDAQTAGEPGREAWSERWGKNRSGESDWVDKTWSREEAGAKYDWGETAGKEHGKRWAQKWFKNHGSSGHDEYQEKWDDDGFGNLKTVKKGTKWQNGEVTEWFTDSFGENLANSEKWAFKEGFAQNDGQWVEKWNETPENKSAFKQGHNERGDAWREEWREKRDPGTGEQKETWAEKTGRNASGQEWVEEWCETQERKVAKKRAVDPTQGSQWEEAWGEECMANGAGQKWTSKWAEDMTGKWGNNWGDSWGPDGNNHNWGELWKDNWSHKWSN